MEMIKSDHELTSYFHHQSISLNPSCLCSKWDDVPINDQCIMSCLLIVTVVYNITILYCNIKRRITVSSFFSFGEKIREFSCP